MFVQEQYKKGGDDFTRYIGNNVSYINIVALKNTLKVAPHNKGFKHVRWYSLVIGFRKLSWLDALLNICRNIDLFFKAEKSEVFR